MREIEHEFDYKGFRFKLLRRQGKIALFEKSRIGHASKSWEVVVLQEFKERTWPDGTITEAHECLPSSETWGTYGFTYSDAQCGDGLKAAKSKYQSLLE